MLTNKRVSLYISIFLMFFIGTGSFAFVISSLWNREVLLNEIKHTQNILTQFAFYNHKCDQFISASHLFKDNNIRQAGCLAENQIQLYPKSEDEIEKETGLAKLLKQLEIDKNKNTIIETNYTNFLQPTNSTITVARKLEQENKILIFAIQQEVATSFAKTSNYKTLALSFLIINSLAFTLLLTYRLYTLVLKPVENMISTIKSSWKEIHQEPLNLDNLNEFNQLWYYLKQMISRIHKDNIQLQANIDNLSQLNAELQQLQEESVRAEKLAIVGRLSSGLAHEIGNPLTIIKGYLELMSHENISLEQYKEFSQRSEKEIERIDKLIRQLLNCSRQTTPDITRLNVTQIINDSSEDLKVHLNKHNISITLLSSRDSFFALAEESGLRQVLMNCLLNSIDAILERKNRDNHFIKIDTFYKIFQNKRYTVITLSDSGKSISKKYIKNVFDPFFTTKEPGKGVGLGLAVSHALIDQYGGKMSIYNLPGGGTQLTIMLLEN